MRVHFVTAAEAIPRHCNMVRLWAFSIRRFGGAFAQSNLTVVFNDKAHEPTARLLERESGVRIEVRPRISRTSPHANKYNALHAEGANKADFVLLTDADVACANPLDPLTSELTGDTAFAAVPELFYPELSGGPGTLPIYGYANLLRSLVPYLSQDQLDRHVHKWFDGVNPFTRYPLFNGGMICVRTDRLAAFRTDVLTNTDKLWHAMSRKQLNPTRTLINAWNSRITRSRTLRKLTIGYYFSRGFSDQVSLFPTALALNMPCRVLPHAFNWRHMNSGHGDDSPPRLIHYYQLALGLDPARILDPDWLDDFAKSDNPGQRELAKVARAYLDTTSEPPVR